MKNLFLKFDNSAMDLDDICAVVLRESSVKYNLLNPTKMACYCITHDYLNAESVYLKVFLNGVVYNSCVTCPDYFGSPETVFNCSIDIWKD